jgi:hypothetical protein
MRITGEPDLRITEQDAGTPEFKRSYDRVGQYKQKWAEIKQAQEVADGTRSPENFHHPIGKEEHAWRSEMRLSGRMLGLELMDLGRME